MVSTFEIRKMLYENPVYVHCKKTLYTMVSIFDIHKMLSENPVYVHCKKRLAIFPSPAG
jgi:hypothetical protein